MHSLFGFHDTCDMKSIFSDKSNQERNSKQKREGQKQKKTSLKKSSSNRSRKYENEDEASQEVPESAGRLENQQ